MGYTDEAPKASYFCKILAETRAYKIEGYWSGSIYRHHPCGIIRSYLILSNEWNVNNYCYASVMTEPDHGTTKPSNNPASWNGDPHPHPKVGDEMKIYTNGRWIGEDGPWRKEVWRVLHELEVEIEEKQLKNEWDRIESELIRKRSEIVKWERLRKTVG